MKAQGTPKGGAGPLFPPRDHITPRMSVEGDLEVTGRT